MMNGFFIGFIFHSVIILRKRKRKRGESITEVGRGRTGMSEAEMREEIQKMLAEADRATLDELRVFIEYYLGGQDER